MSMPFKEYRSFVAGKKELAMNLAKSQGITTDQYVEYMRTLDDEPEVDVSELKERVWREVFTAKPKKVSSQMDMFIGGKQIEGEIVFDHTRTDGTVERRRVLAAYANGIQLLGQLKIKRENSRSVLNELEADEKLFELYVDRSKGDLNIPLFDVLDKNIAAA